MARSLEQLKKERQKWLKKDKKAAAIYGSSPGNRIRDDDAAVILPGDASAEQATSNHRNRILTAKEKRLGSSDYQKQRERDRATVQAVGRIYETQGFAPLRPTTLPSVPEIAPVGTGSQSGKDIVWDDVPRVGDSMEQSGGWIKKGLFEDGYDLFDVSKTILGTAADVVEDVGAGIAEVPERVIDAFASLEPYRRQGQLYVDAYSGGDLNATTVVVDPEKLQRAHAFDLAQAQAEAGEFIKRDLYDGGAFGKAISQAIFNIPEYEDISILGEKTDASVQSIGQTLASMGLQAVGVPWWLTTGAAAYGAEMENALNQEATHEEAMGSAAINAAVEVIIEKLGGGISFGGKTLDDALTRLLAKGISNKLARTAAKLGLDIAGEAGEEVLSELAGNAASALYRLDEESWKEIMLSEEAMQGYLDAAIGGGLMGGVSGGFKAAGSARTGVDYTSGLTKNEQTVVNQILKERLAEAKKNNERASRLRLYDQIVADMDRGRIATGDIERILGGDSYKDYQDAMERENAVLKQEQELKEEFNRLNEMNPEEMTPEQIARQSEIRGQLKALSQQAEEIRGNSQAEQLRQQLDGAVSDLVRNDRLMESYNERARRGQAFEADLTRYDAKQRETVKRAMESGVLNNTNRSHELVDFVAKIEADKGVKFDFTNNRKLKDSGFGVEGKTVNGFVTKDGITLNTESSKYLQSVAGHEITHVLEGTEFYNEMQQAVFDYARSKGELGSRWRALKDLYKDMEGTDINAELTADLVGDYLFGDADFVRSLSAQNRNVFQKMWDEIKYLCRVATAGSKELKELERVKHLFEKAYREGGKVQTETKYSLSYTTDNRAVATIDSDIFDGKFEELTESERVKIVKNAIKGFRPGIPVSGRMINITRKSAEHFTNSDYTDKLRNNEPAVYEDKLNLAKNIDDVIYASTDYINEELKHPRKDNISQFARGTVLLDIGGNKYEANVLVGYTTMQEMVLYDVQDLTPTSFSIKEKKMQPTLAGNESDTSKTVASSQVGRSVKSDTLPTNTNVAQNDDSVKYSLSDAGTRYDNGVALEAETSYRDDLAPVRADLSQKQGPTAEDFSGAAPEAPAVSQDDLAPVEDDLRQNDNGAAREAEASSGDGLTQAQEELLQKSEENPYAEKLLSKWENSRTEAEKLETLHAESLAVYDQRVQKLQAQYDAMKNKDTKTARDILRRIERWNRLRADADADYKKRIANAQARASKAEGAYREWQRRKMYPGQRVAQTGAAPAQKGKTNPWMMAANRFLDKGAVFEIHAKKTGNEHLEGLWDYALPSKVRARANYFMAHGNDDTKSLQSIMDSVKGREDAFDQYLAHLRNIDSMTLETRFGVPNKPVFGETITAEVSRQRAAELEKANPEFKEAAEDVYQYYRFLRNMDVEKGIITKETAELWEKMYPHYAAIARNVTGESRAAPRNPGVSAPVKRAKGGSADIHPMFQTMAERTVQTFKAAAMNDFGVELKNSLDSTIATEDVNLFDVMENPVDHGSNLKNGDVPTFSVYEKGKKVTFEITPDMHDALKPSDPFWNMRFKPLTAVSDLRRNLLTTWGQVFSFFRNPVKDTKTVLFNSRHAAKTYMNYPEAIQELATGGEFYQEYMRNGGGSTSFYHEDTGTFGAQESIGKKLLGLDKLEAAGEFVEKVPRLAEYIASRQEGRTVQQAMLDSARVTTNFAAGGDVTRFVNAHGANFLNASVQGAAQTARNVYEAISEGPKGWAKLAGKALVRGLPSVLLNHLLWDDDEDFEALSDYVKENYVIVGKLPNGTFVRIPKGREEIIISDAMEQVIGFASGDDGIDFFRFCELVFDNLAPSSPIDNNILAPIGQAVNNTTWYGEDLVPSRLQDLPASEQFDESTDAISRWLGEHLEAPLEAVNSVLGTEWEASPYKINYLLDQYSGGIGDVILPMLTPEAESGDNSLLGNVLAPWKKELTTDSVMNNRNPTEFYTIRDKLAVASNGKNATQEDKLRKAYMDAVGKEMKGLYAEKRDIQSGDLPDDEKYEAVRDIQKEINTLAENALNRYEDVYIDGVYAEVADRQYIQKANGEWAEATGSQMEAQELGTEALDITPGEYWAVRTGVSGRADAEDATDEDKLRDRFIDYIVGEIYDLNDEKEAVQTNSGLSASEKASRTAAVEDRIQKFGSEYRQYFRSDLNVDFEAGNYAHVGDSTYYRNDKGQWNFIYYNQKIKQEKISNALGISASEYWSKKDEYNFIYSNVDKYNRMLSYGLSFEEYTQGGREIASLVSDDPEVYERIGDDLYNIDAKDSSLHSVSGLKKKRVQEYIRNLDVDDGVKMILYKNEYASDDRYNDDILAYLNSRSDLSRSQIKNILIGLGALVDENGYVHWD